MAGAFIEIKINDVELERKLLALTDKCEDLSAPMKIIGEYMTQSVRENFIVGGRPVAWKPLSQQTLMGLIGGSRRGRLSPGEAQRKLEGKKILIGRGMAGGLMSSIHPVADKTSVKIGTDKKYGATHQFGRGNIPARPFLVLQDEDKEMILSTIKKHLLEKS